jgi:hypothetical protein
MRNVENSPPDPATAPGPSKKLPEFLVFWREIKPLLTLVQQRDLEPLLRCLYQAAQRKMHCRLSERQ